jgi:hypothetical protein
MRAWLTRSQTAKRKALDLYGVVVTAARRPSFYGPERVSDTPEGRFDLIALHLFLVAERLTSVKPEGEEQARHIIEAFVTDMDDCMREMGVGDLTVPKRVKRAAAVFYERTGLYRDALAVRTKAGDGADPLSAVIAATLLQSEKPSQFSNDMATYVRSSHAGLERTKYSDVTDGNVAFASPPLVTA